MYSYGSSSAYDFGAALGGFVGGVIIFALVICLIALAIAVVQIIATWKILEKGGKPGWAALIPFYNQYQLCDMVGVSPWWILIVLVCGLLSAIPIIGGLLSLAASIYFAILLNVSLARSFGKEDGFAVGLILLAPVFYCILGFGKNEFVGKNPMNDAVMDAVNKNTSSNGTTNNANKKFCTSCGASADKDTKFCPSCGKEM